MVGFLIKRSHQGGLLADNCPPLKGFGGQNNPSDGRHPLTAAILRSHRHCSSIAFGQRPRGFSRNSSFLFSAGLPLAYRVTRHSKGGKKRHTQGQRLRSLDGRHSILNYLYRSIYKAAHHKYKQNTPNGSLNLCPFWFSLFQT